MSISEDEVGDEVEVEDESTATSVDRPRAASPAAKWGMAGLLLAYAGFGSYSLASALGQGTGPGHPEGVTRSVTTALGKSAADSPATVTGKAYAAKAFARVQAAAAAAPKVEALSAVGATAIGPAGARGDHPQIAPLVLDGNSATAWVTHWYASAYFGNLKLGTGLVLDMGRMVMIRQVQLALGGSPGLWGADIQIRVGDSPGKWNIAPAAVCTDVGGWVAPELHTPVTGRYVQIWFTKLPRDSWGTYQEHVYGVTVHGSVPAHTASHSGRAGGGAHPAGGSHSWPGGYRGAGAPLRGGHGGGYPHGGHGR